MRIPFITPPRTPVRGTWPWVIALLCTAYLCSVHGWNDGILKGYVVGMKIGCPKIVSRGLIFSVQDAEARAALPADSPLRADLADYDRLRTDAQVCGVLMLPDTHESFWRTFLTNTLPR